MSINVGFYDFFAYTVPGAFYLLTTAYLAYSLDAWKVNFQVLKDFATAATILAIIIACMLGILLDQFARLWQRLFIPHNTEIVVLEELKENFPDLNIKIRPNEEAILRAYIKEIYGDTSSSIEKYGSTRTMLRNISLNFFILFIIFLVQAIISNQSQSLPAALSIASLVFSFSAGKQIERYNKWYYALTYETIIASSLSPGDFVEKRRRASTRNKKAG